MLAAGGSAACSSGAGTSASALSTASAPSIDLLLETNDGAGVRELRIPAGGSGGWLGDALHPVDAVTATGSALSFRMIAPDGTATWFRGTLTEGVFAGRFAHGSATAPPPASAFQSHATGWSRDVFEASIVPRVFDVTVGDDRAVLRIDAAPPHAGDAPATLRFTGRMKTYATAAAGIAGEQEELDAEVPAWDGAHLSMRLHLAGGVRTLDARVDGRDLHGTYVDDAAPLVSRAFSGVRSEVLAYGLTRRDPAARTAWQEATRARLAALMMAGGAPPVRADVRVLADGVSPSVPSYYPPGRDDDPDQHPAAYHLSEIAIDTAYADTSPAAGAPIARTVHGWIATPDAPAPAGGFPAVIVVNGHSGSAAAMFDPQDGDYWFGDGFARRGFVVMAIDISHRPYEDRASLYADTPNGDDPLRGNVAHPAIKAPGFDSDWEEDGERIADVMRGREALVARRGVDASHVYVMGLSLGGEIATFAAAMDTGFAGGVAAGFSPDLAVVEAGSNHPCWKWQHARVRDYLSTSDLHALIAPRTFVVETGRRDITFSGFFAAPFAADKQVARRTREAYATEVDHFVHYLHYDEHRFHVGDLDPTLVIAERSVRVPVETRPNRVIREGWQIDPTTSVHASTVFDFLASEK